MLFIVIVALVVGLYGLFCLYLGWQLGYSAAIERCAAADYERDCAAFEALYSTPPAVRVPVHPYTPSSN